MQCIQSLARQRLKEGYGLCLGHVSLREALNEYLGPEAVEELVDVLHGDVEDDGVLLTGLPVRLLNQRQPRVGVELGGLYEGVVVVLLGLLGHRLEERRRDPRLLKGGPIGFYPRI